MKARLPVCLLLIGILCPGLALACTIPVFRFALDRWEADPFRLVIPSTWATRPDLVKLLIPLRGNGEANLRVEEDPNATEARLLFPHDDVPIWSGPLDAGAVKPLLDSPTRQELIRHVLAGDSVIWVVCTTEEDKAHADRIEKRLQFLAQVATLPPQNPSDPDSQLGPGPKLELKFRVLRVSLDNPEEKPLISMLAGPARQDLVEGRRSFAAPVFGRGRVLGSWPVETLDETAIEDASLFLIGRCSCRVKNENPGWDLVLKIDWDRALAQSGGPARSAAVEPSPEPSVVVTKPVEMNAVPASAGSSWVAIALVAAVLAALGATIYQWIKPKL